MSRRCQGRGCCVVKTAVLVFILTIVGAIVRFLPRHHVENTLTYLSNKKQSTFLSNDEKEILSQHIKKHLVGLLELRHTITSPLHSHTLARQLKMLQETLQYIQHDFKIPKHYSKKKVAAPATTKQEVCPEKFVGKDLGYGAPYYRLGFALVDCTEFVPIDKLITLLLYTPTEHPKPSQSYVEMIGDIAKYYPGVRVILATKAPLPQDVISTVSNLAVKFKNEIVKKPMGTMWSKFLDQVNTPYVLVAPHITHFDDDINLHRLVRILSNRDDVAIAGGSYRNLTGHWDLGCRQESFNYWTAKYSSGYYRSFNECVVCDYLPGPFVAKTKLLKKLAFDKSLSDGVFLDFFWRLKRNSTISNLAVVCADIMFNIDNHQNITDGELVRFADKHNIKKMITPDGAVHWFGCKRGLSHTKGKTCSWSDGIGAPPCDLENLADVIRFTMATCEKHNIVCEYAANSILGAVKFSSVTPWPGENDTHIYFHTTNYSALNQLQPIFERAGFIFKSESSGFGKFEITTKKFKIFLHARKSLDVGDMLAAHLYPTRVAMAGAWVATFRNPGLLSRNRYGQEYFRHAEHAGKDSVFARGFFRTCPKPGHSACLDQYRGDGNMQFLEYVPP